MGFAGNGESLLNQLDTALRLAQGQISPAQAGNRLTFQAPVTHLASYGTCLGSQAQGSIRFVENQVQVRQVLERPSFDEPAADFA
jgi:hypothetical protein